jgi:hypothetical protein
VIKALVPEMTGGEYQDSAGGPSPLLRRSRFVIK